MTLALQREKTKGKNGWPRTKQYKKKGENKQTKEPFYMLYLCICLESTNPKGHDWGC